MQAITPSQNPYTAINQNDINEPIIIFDKSEYIELDKLTTDKLSNLQLKQRKRSDYNNLLEHYKLFQIAKEQLLSDIKQLQELSRVYLGNQHQYDISSFYERIKNPKPSDLKGQFDLYVNTRKHIHFLVQKLIENQAQSRDQTTEPSKQTTEDRNFLVRMLTSSLEVITESLPEIESCLENVYDSLMLFEKNNLTSYFSKRKEEHFHHVINSLIIKFNNEGICDISESDKIHYFSEFHNCCCEEFNISIIDRMDISKIDNRYLDIFLSKWMKNLVKTEVFAFTDNAFILQEIAEEYLSILEDILKKHNIPLNSPFSANLISDDLNQEIDEAICVKLNALMKITGKNSLNVNDFIEYDYTTNETMYCFKSRKESLMAWIASTAFESDLGSKVFATLPLNKKNKLCIASMNNTFFWVFTGQKSNRTGQACIFDKNNHIPLELSHLKSVDFSSWNSESIICTLLIQALNQTEKAEDVVAFFCNPNVINQLNKIPKKTYQKLMAVLNKRVINDESFKNNIYQLTYNYIENHQVETQTIPLLNFRFTSLLQNSSLNVYNRMKWLIDTPILEPILLKLHENNIDISKIKKSLTHEYIGNLSVACIKKIFTITECQRLFTKIIEKSLVRSDVLDKLIQTGYHFPELYMPRKSKPRKINDMMPSLFSFKDGTIPLSFLAEQGNPICIERLVTEAATDVNISNNKLKTLLSLATNYGHIKAVEILFRHENIDKVIKRNGMTALHYVCKNGTGSIIEESLTHTNIDVNAKDNNGKTALEYACEKKCNFELFKILLSHKEIDVNAINNDGDTAFMLACNDGYLNYVKEFLLHPKVDVNATNNYENTALMHACCNNRVECVNELFLHPKVDVNAKNNYGNTAFLFACNNGYLDCVKEFLLNRKIDVNSKNDNGYTPLMAACLDGQLECVKELLKNKRIDVNGKDNNGKTALDLAFENCADCFDFLLASDQLDDESKRKYSEYIIPSANLLI